MTAYAYQDGTWWWWDLTILHGSGWLGARMQSHQKIMVISHFPIRSRGHPVDLTAQVSFLLNLLQLEDTSTWAAGQHANHWTTVASWAALQWSYVATFALMYRAVRTSLLASVFLPGCLLLCFISNTVMGVRLCVAEHHSHCSLHERLSIFGQSSCLLHFHAEGPSAAAVSSPPPPFSSVFPPPSSSFAFSYTATDALSSACNHLIGCRPSTNSAKPSYLFSISCRFLYDLLILFISVSNCQRHSWEVVLAWWNSYPW